jgi:hypothetical protein
VPIRKADNRQPPGTKAQAAIDKKSLIIGATVLNDPCHPFKKF